MNYESRSLAGRLGLSNKDKRKYSLRRAVLACAENNWSQAGFELECSRAVQSRTNKFLSHPYAFSVPIHDLFFERDLTVASGAAGGYLVETQNVGFIELLRNRTALLRLGATRLLDLVGSVTVPKQTAGATAVWLTNESSQISESAPAFGQVALAPKTVGAYVEISRQLLLQSDPSAEAMVANDLAKVVGLAVDGAGINGSGSGGEPTGILNTSGIGSVTGTSLAYAGIIDFQSDVGNALVPECAYLTTPTVAGLLMARQRFSNTDTPLWDGGMLDARMAGFRAMSTAGMPSATMIFGDFSQVVIAEWGDLEITVNPFTNFQAGIIGVRAMYSVDIGIRYPQAFSAATSIT
jgi:HK97 family phage major capsid protein